MVIALFKKIFILGLVFLGPIVSGAASPEKVTLTVIKPAVPSQKEKSKLSLLPEQEYQKVQQELSKGWNTWNTHSVLSHVLLPESFALNICLRDTRITGERYLKDAYISQKEKRPETITPGPHAYDGSYTELTLTWNGTTVKVQSATDGDDLVLLINPSKTPARVPQLILESAMLWNRPGHITKQGDKLQAQLASRIITVGSPSVQITESVPAASPYLAFKLDGVIGIYTGSPKSLAQIQALIQKQRNVQLARATNYKNLSESYQAIQGVMAWNTIFDPTENRVITPVSRYWNTFFGGNFVLFCWDTYFGAYLAALDNKNLAYANALEVTRGIKNFGMVPNYVSAGDLGSPDRSQPPVGSTIIREIYRKYSEKWFLEYAFEDLLTWNRWWTKNRDNQGFMSWGSNPVPPPYDDDAADNWQGAAYESGLDNSPMFDKVPFNKKKHVLELADVGLTSLYIADCQALAEIAKILGKTKEQKELEGRAKAYGQKLLTLWSKEHGIYLNKRTDTGELSTRLSPTNFYPLLTGLPSPAQANQMMQQHYFNPKEFYGEWMLPAIAKNDAAFTEQNYWRGRIWGPLNMLVYLGMRKYNIPEARQDLVQKSNKLLLHTYRKTGMVHENYQGITGNGIEPDERLNKSDSFYHWGGLLGLISFIEAGYMGPQKGSVVK